MRWRPYQTKSTGTARAPIEVITLEAEAMPVELSGEGYLCVSCWEVIPKAQYASHRQRKDCISPGQPPATRPPARPPAARRKRKSSCETCHRTIRSERENDFHEPCNAANNNIAEEPKKRKQQPEVNSSVNAAAIRQRDKQVSNRAANKIATYHAVLEIPNSDGTYNVDGKIVSISDIKRGIRNLRGLLVK